jgi:hypothetical protein
MSETANNDYKHLFEVRLLHHYWLDQGSTVFDDLPVDEAERASLPDPKPAASQEQRLWAYNKKPFLKITPTESTANALRGLAGIYFDTALGCVVAVPEQVAVPADAVFEFIVTVIDSTFFNYTAMTLNPQRVYTFSVPSKDDPLVSKTYRYKENVPVLSNLTGTKGTGADNALFLSQKIPALQDSDRIEALVTFENALWQLTSDPPNADKQQISLKAPGNPVFVNQADIPAVIPSEGLVGAPARGVELTDEMPNNVYAIIRLSAKRQDDPDFSLADRPEGKNHPVFQVRFKNRSSVWQYFSIKNRAAINHGNAEPLPLTYFGNAGTKQKPSDGMVDIKRNTEKTRITRLVSNIFI